MNTPDELQNTLENWNGAGDPPQLSAVQKSPGYQALSPAGRIAAINQTQRNWADRLSADDPANYGDVIRDVETDFQKARQNEVETHLATDLAEGKFTDQQVRDYTAGRVSLMDYPEQKDLAGPWVTTKLPLDKGQGFVYVRHAPDLSAEGITSALKPVRPDGQDVGEYPYPMAKYAGPQGSDRVEVAWQFRGQDGKPIKGVDDVNVGGLFATVATGENHYGPLYGQNPAEKEAERLSSVPPALRPAMAATEVFSSIASQRPEISDKIGQGFWQGLPGEAAKGFLALGNAALHAPSALLGDMDAVRAWQQGQSDINADIEGQSRLAFRGALTDKVLQGISSEAIPMAFSMGAGAIGAVARKALTSAVGKTFLSRMAALEMEQAARQGLTGMTREAAAKLIAGELTGEGVGSTARQGLMTSIARGYFGKWLGTAEIEGPLARQLADRVANAVAFLPSSARSGMDNMATTLNKAAELRASGDEAGARELERNAVLNGWAGVGIETLSENIWLNEMMVTRAGHSLAHVSNAVLERTLQPGRMAKLAERGRQFVKEAIVRGNEEGVEEVVAGMSGRQWMNEFARQNQDLLSDVPQEYLTGAALGSLMSGARALAQDGQPAAFRALVTRGIDGDIGAMAALARIRTRADAIASQKALAAAANNPPGTGAALSSSPPPAVVAGAAESGAVPGAPVPGRLANIAGSVPPPIVTGDATEAPAGTMDNTLVPPAPADVANASPPPETISPEGAVALPDPTAQDTSSNLEAVSPAVNNPDPMAAPASPDAPGNLLPMPDGAPAAPPVPTSPEDTTPVPAGAPAPETAVRTDNQPTAPATPNADPGNALATEYAALQAELDSKGVAAKVATLRAKGTTAFAGRVGKIVQRMREIEASTAPETIRTAPESAVSNPQVPRTAPDSAAAAPESVRVAPESAVSNTQLPRTAPNSAAAAPESVRVAPESAVSNTQLPRTAPNSAAAAPESIRVAPDEMNPFSRAAGIDPDHLTGVPAKAATDALGALRVSAPELARNVTLVQNPAQLDPADYSPTTWTAINDPQVEGFYNAKTGETIILTDHITRRPGETAIGATARVILHERLAHAGLAILRASDPAFAKEWKALTDAIPVEELLALLPAYPHLRDSPELLAEEWFARQAEAAKSAPEGSLLRRMWEALKRALIKLWHRLQPGSMTLNDRVAEMLYQSRKALRKGAPGQPGAAPEIQESRNPYERRDWQSVPLPQWAKNKLGARAVAPFEVRSQEARAILTGSPMPREFARIAAQTQEEIKAVQDRGAAIAADLQAAMKSYAKRTGTDLQRVSDDINTALEDPAMMAAIADPVLKTRAIAARNFVDVLSDEVANTTGGQLGKTIRQNAGHWLRRSYAAFDDSAGWDATTLREAARAGKQLAGRDARTILANARAYLLTQFPKTPPLGIEVMISDLTNRDAWQSATFGIPRADGSRVSREVSSFMQRQTIAPEIRALMGEERNPIKRLSRSIGIQAQLIARYDQQRAMRDLGLAMGVFSTTATAIYHRPVGGTDVHGNMRWNGFAITDPATGKSQPVYTTPEMEAALNAASAVDGKNLGGVILRAYKALGTEAKLNRVALNPDSWAVNIFGNVLGLVQSGDMFHFAGWQRIAEAVRLHASSREMSGDAVNAVAEAIREQQRALVGRMAAAGVAGASFDMRDLEASIDQATLAFIQGTPLRNIAAGATRGAIAGQAFGKAAGSVGQVIGGAAGAVAGGIVGGRRITAVQRAIAQAVLSAPDNIGKIAVFLGNYATGKSAGMADQAAFDMAAEKTRNTMPDYSKLPALLRETSKLGIMGSFIAFQWEVYRNYYHNIRYAFQELKSGNAAMVARGLRRMLGTATVTALGSGLVATIAGAGGDDKDEAYRRALGAPWERFSKLAYTKLDGEEASFFNTSYLIPQTSLFEIFRAASEGKSFEDGLTNALGAARRQFFGGSVSADPILEALMNTKMAGGKVTYEDGFTGFFERVGHVLRVTNEPGAANKAERIGKAIRGEELRGRKFSLQEEVLRALGIRQGTYRHEDRIRGKLYTIREAYSDARAAANKAWRDTPMERDSAIARANERIAAVEKDFGELQADLQTIGVPKSKVEAIRKDVKLGVNFHRLKAGKDGPESIIK